MGTVGIYTYIIIIGIYFCSILMIMKFINVEFRLTKKISEHESPAKANVPVVRMAPLQINLKRVDIDEDLNVPGSRCVILFFVNIYTIVPHIYLPSHHST